MPDKQFDVDADLIRRLTALLEETGLSEIELGDGERRVRVVRNSHAVNSQGTNAPTPEAQATAGDPAGAVAAAEANPPGAVSSPMVGTVFTAPEPGAPAFVKIGDRVEEGDTLFIIEAMKVMNPIRAPRGGTVSDVLVENGSPVEFGETLLVLA